jgi:hypothetical protein
MTLRAVGRILIAALLCLAVPVAAQMPPHLATENAELLIELIGAPVFARDGEQVGEVADVRFDDEGRPRALRVKTSAHLGLGTRTVKVPDGAFITLRGAVSLEMPADAVRALREVIEPGAER